MQKTRPGAPQRSAGRFFIAPICGSSLPDKLVKTATNSQPNPRKNGVGSQVGTKASLLGALFKTSRRNSRIFSKNIIDPYAGQPQISLTFD
ncbi:hypothetical protein [Phaeobacter sp. CECT 5382]|uniref:hypothetical protein n=1 Tax=Phaeobacter sp. CECT 5382 TaxID=1712645 RepID=UPI0012E356F4|nr:hypothetical protein [Phaeobacter sp. CECT 5382]